MITMRRTGLGIGLLAALAIAASQAALVLAGPAPKAAVGVVYQTSGGTNIGTSGSYVTVADMVLPAGKYHVTARGLVNNQTGVPVNVISCNAYAGSTFVDVGDTSVPMEYAGFAIDGTADMPTGGTLRVECISDSVTLPYPIVGISLVAESVGGITILP